MSMSAGLKDAQTWLPENTVVSVSEPSCRLDEAGRLVIRCDHPQRLRFHAALPSATTAACSSAGNARAQDARDAAADGGSPPAALASMYVDAVKKEHMPSLKAPPANGVTHDSSVGVSGTKRAPSATVVPTPLELKEQGNLHFKMRAYELARRAYTQAIIASAGPFCCATCMRQSTPCDPALRVILHSNRAAVHLSLGYYMVSASVNTSSCKRGRLARPVAWCRSSCVQ